MKEDSVMKGKALLCAAVCAMVLVMGVGCSQQNDTLQGTEHDVQSDVILNQSAAQSPSVSSYNETVSSGASLFDQQKATTSIYIGSDDSFKEISCSLSQSPTSKQLIEAIAEETGWNLALADVTTSGRGGTLVCFAKESVLFTELPEQQKNEYYMYGKKQLVRTVLDSIEKTLQTHIRNSGIHDPAAMHIYYCMEGGQPLVLPEINLTISIEEPYDTSIWNSIEEKTRG